MEKKKRKKKKKKESLREISYFFNTKIWLWYFDVIDEAKFSIRIYVLHLLQVCKQMRERLSALSKQ
jgi:hypothetical protein